jgi:hypothetical protein
MRTVKEVGVTVEIHGHDLTRYSSAASARSFLSPPEIVERRRHHVSRC